MHTNMYHKYPMFIGNQFRPVVGKNCFDGSIPSGWKTGWFLQEPPMFGRKKTCVLVCVSLNQPIEYHISKIYPKHILMVGLGYYVYV